MSNSETNKEIRQFLIEIQTSQHESYQWLKLHQQNIRSIIAGLIMCRRQLNGELTMNAVLRDEKCEESIDPDSILLPLMIPNMFNMLHTHGSDAEVAIMYLEILIEKKMLTSDIIRPHCSASRERELKGTIYLDNKENFIFSLSAALGDLLHDINFRHLWKRVENILRILAE